MSYSFNTHNKYGSISSFSFTHLHCIVFCMCIYLRKTHTNGRTVSTFMDAELKFLWRDQQSQTLSDNCGTRGHRHVRFVWRLFYPRDVNELWKCALQIYSSLIYTCIYNARKFYCGTESEARNMIWSKKQQAYLCRMQRPRAWFIARNACISYQSRPHSRPLELQ